MDVIQKEFCIEPPVFQKLVGTSEQTNVESYQRYQHLKKIIKPQNLIRRVWIFDEVIYRYS